MSNPQTHVPQHKEAQVPDHPSAHEAATVAVEHLIDSVDAAEPYRGQLADKEMGHLYGFVEVGLGRVKIGRSSDVARRLAQIRTSSPHPVELVMYVPHAGWLEALVHEILAPFRAHGEWFSAHPRVVEFVRGMQERAGARDYAGGPHEHAGDVLVELGRVLRAEVAP